MRPSLAWCTSVPTILGHRRTAQRRPGRRRSGYSQSRYCMMWQKSGSGLGAAGTRAYRKMSWLPWLPWLPWRWQQSRAAKATSVCGASTVVAEVAPNILNLNILCTRNFFMTNMASTRTATTNYAVCAVPTGQTRAGGGGIGPGGHHNDSGALTCPAPAPPLLCWADSSFG